MDDKSDKIQFERQFYLYQEKSRRQENIRLYLSCPACYKDLLGQIMGEVKKINLSAVLIIGEEDLEILGKSIESVRWCAEVVLVFDQSNPEAQKLIEETKEQIVNSGHFKSEDIKIYKRALNQDFAGQRNFGLDKASFDWVLFIDADEIVPEELQSEISNYLVCVNLDKINGFCLHRADYIFGKKLQYGETSHVKLIRLGKKGKGTWHGKVHEEWDIKGQIITLSNSLRHYPHQAISVFLDKINFYTDIVSKTWFEEKKTVNIWQIIFFPVGKFLQNYFLRLGMLDGTAGFIMALMMSFHSFLARSKLWLLYRKKDE